MTHGGQAMNVIGIVAHLEPPGQSLRDILAAARESYKRGARGDELIEATRLACAQSVCAVMAKESRNA
jgi:hypothetical protein